jgi:hypothetical protein
MARFYATFEHNLQFPTLQENASTKAFLKKNIGATAQQGLDLQAGLIASRSLLSAAIYSTLDSINIDGSRGTYFPPDLITTNLTTFVSGPVYTSSVDGIKTPITNTYDVGQAINYSKRPTSSITSSQTTLVGPTTNPPDTGSAAYSLYKNATDAVATVLTSIQGGGPYDRLGQIPLRTLHSIWNDPNLNYFAWDDFTPGTGSVLVDISPIAGTGQVTYVTSSTTVGVSLGWLTEFPSDLLGNAIVFATLLGPTNNTLATLSPTGTPAASGYLWNVTANSFNTMTGSLGQPVTLEATVAFSDVTIPTNNGAAQQTVRGNFATIVRLTTLTQNILAALSPNDPCYAVNIPIYGTWDAGSGVFPGDNPGGNPFNFIPSVYRNLTDPLGFNPLGILPIYGSQDYWLIQSTTNPPSANQQMCKYTTNGVKVLCQEIATPCQGTPLCGPDGGFECTVDGGECPDGCVCSGLKCVPAGEVS